MSGMEVVSPDIRFATAHMEGYNVNALRLETNGQTSATPGSIVTINLPSNATVDMKSFKVHLSLATTGKSAAGVGRFPSDTSSLIQQCEVYAGGVQIAQGFSEFCTVARVKKIINESLDRTNSIERTLQHSTLEGFADAEEAVDVIFKPQIGLFNECSTRYWPLGVLGDVSIRLTLASNAVLAVGKPADSTVAGGGSAASYQATNIFATINTVTLGDMYERMLLERLSSEQYLSCNFKEYYTFSDHNFASSQRFSLSASSIDRMYTILRDTAYQTSQKLPVATGGINSEAKVANFFNFQSFGSASAVGVQNGTLTYHYEVNNVKHPQYEATLLDAAHDLSMISNSVGLTDNGNLITSFKEFQQTKCIYPLQLCMPGQPVAVKSGYNSRGNNSYCTVTVNSIVKPGGVASVSCMTICETTAELRIAGAKQLSVVY